MEEKKAGWGILITMSWFTTGCAAKARDHGRMELIDGWKLTSLIKEHLGKDVLIGISKKATAQDLSSAVGGDLGHGRRASSLMEWGFSMLGTR